MLAGVKQLLKPQDRRLFRQTISVDEDLAVGQPVACLGVSHAEHPLTFTIITDPDSKFSIYHSFLILEDPLDYEGDTFHDVVIAADDGFSHVKTLYLRVLVNDLDDDGDYVFTNAEAEAWVTAMATAPTDVQSERLDTLVGALKAGGAWAKLDALYLFAGHDGTDALINATDPGVNDCTTVNSPEWIQWRGYRSIGGATPRYLNTTINPTTDLTLGSLNDCTMGVWQMADSGGWIAPYVTGARTGDNVNETLIGHTSSAGTHFDVGVGGNNTNSTTHLQSTVANYIVATRPNSTQCKAYINDTLRATYSRASSAFPNLDIFIGGYNDAGASASNDFGNYEISLWHIGSAWSDAEQAAAYDAFEVYLTAVGAL